MIVQKSSIGVVGGMGPLASAVFVKNIYEMTLHNKEQESPKIILFSDPSLPDRTETFLHGNPKELLPQLLSTLVSLKNCNCSSIVICCVTMHYLWSLIPQEFKNEMTSLIDLILSEVLLQKKKSLLLCSSGSRKLQLFENHALWEQAAPYIVLLSLDDQTELHRYVYLLKQNKSLDSAMGYIHCLLDKYKTDTFIAGCTELHLLSRNFTNCIDPLDLFIKKELLV